MASMPGMQGQNPHAGAGGHDAHQLSAVLSEVQTGGSGERHTTEDGSY